MSEDIGLHARMTANSGNTDAVMEQFLNKLIELEQESKLLKKSQKEIEKEIDNATQKYGENSKQVKRLKDDLNDNYRGQKQLKDEIKQVNSAIKQQTDEYAKNAKQAENVVSGTERIKNGINMIKAVILGYAGKTLFDALIGDNAKFEQYITSFEVMLGSYEKANRLMDDLNDFAAKTPLELGDVTKSTQLLLNYGVAQDEVITKLQQLGDVSQGSAEKMNRVALAYGQMVAKQKVTGEELRQMTEAGVPMTQALADALGVTTAQLSKMIEKGEVGIPTLNKALEQLTSEGGKFFGMMDKQSQTAMGLFSTLKDNIAMFARDVGEESFEYLKSELQDLMNTISEMKESGELNEFATEIGDGIAGAINFTTSFLSILWDIKGALLAVGGSVLAFKVAMIGLETVSKVVISFKTFKETLSAIKKAQEAGVAISALYKAAVLKDTAAIEACNAAGLKDITIKGGQITATNAATGATMKLNAALLLNPYVIIAASVIAFTAAIVWLTNAQDRANKKAEEAVDAYKKTKSELESVEKELDDTAKKIDELNAKEKLSFAEKSELENLKAINKELNSRLILLREEAKIKAEEANRAIEERNQKDFRSSGEKASMYETQKVSGQGRTYEVGKSISEEEYFNEAIRKTEELLALGDKRSIQQENELKNLREYIADAGKRYQQDADGYTAMDEQTEQTKQHWLEMADAAARALDPDMWKQVKFEEIFNAETFSECKEQLLELAQAGKITPETINSYQEFRELMSQTGITADELTEAIASAANKAGESASNTGDILSDLAGKVDAIQDKIDTLNSVQESYNKTGYISADMFKTLTDNDLLQYLDFANGKLVINKDALLNDAQAAKEKATADTQASLASNVLAIIQEDVKRTTENAANALGAAKTDANNFDTAARNAAIGAAILADGMSAVYAAYSGEIGESGLSQDAQNKINAAIGNAKKTIGAINNVKVTPVSTSSKSSKKSSKKDNSAKEAEQARKEQVKAYEDAVSEMMRIDERWNNQRQIREEISAQDYLWNLGNRADTYRKYADEVLTIDYMTAEEKADLRKQYLEKAEDLDDEYLKTFQSMQEEEKQAALESLNERKEASDEWIEQQRREGNYDEVIAGIERVKAYMQEYYNQGILSAKEYNKTIKELDKDIYDAKRDKFDAWLKDADTYRSDRNFYDDWGDDSEEEYLTRVINGIEKAKNEGIITANEYYDYISQYMKEFYTLEKNEWEDYIKSEEKRIKEKYQKQMELEKEAITKASELKKKQYDEELERLDALKKKRDEQQEDEDDNLKMERLKNKLEYEVDEDNRKALQKEINKLQESIDDKMFNRDIEARKEAIQKEKEKEIELAQNKIDHITRYFENKMSGVHIANEILQSIDPAEFEGIGDMIGDSISKGIQSKIDGMIRGIRDALKEVAGYSSGSASVYPGSGTKKSTSITIHQKNYGVSTPYQQNVGIKKLVKSLEMGVF